MFQMLPFGVPKGFILGPILFNIFINDLFYFVKDLQLLNFADDNTIATFSTSVNDLITDLQKESENAIDWFRLKEMVVNLYNLQSLIINKLRKFKNSYELLITIKLTQKTS